MYETIRELYYQDQGKPNETIDQWEKEEILKVLHSSEELRQSREYELFRDYAFRIASIAEEGGFIKGFRKAYKIQNDCNSP